MPVVPRAPVASEQSTFASRSVRAIRSASDPGTLRADLWVDANAKPIRGDDGHLLIESPPQTVQVGDDDVLFAAHMSSCPSHQAEEGVQVDNFFYTHAYTMYFVVPDAGNILRLMALMLLVLDSDEPTSLDDYIVATVQQTTAPECDIWDLSGSTIKGVPFFADGIFGFVRECDPVR